MSDVITAAPQPNVSGRPEKVTAALVKAALRARFAQPEWAVLFEVGDATGARHTRFADAVAMSLWPSRGLELHGMEIKVSRYDWQSERKRPEKAETIAAYCDRWWLVTGPGVVQRAHEIPPAWGWMECDGTRLTTIKEAQQTEAKVCDRKFLAALLRRAHKVDDAMVEAEVVRRDADRQARFHEQVKRQAEILVRDRGELRQAVEAFEAAAGFKIADQDLGYWHADAERVGRAVKLVRDLNLAETGFDSLSRAFAGMQQRMAEMGAVMVEAGLLPGLPVVEGTTPKKRRSKAA